MARMAEDGENGQWTGVGLKVERRDRSEDYRQLSKSIEYSVPN